MTTRMLALSIHQGLAPLAVCALTAAWLHSAAASTNSPAPLTNAPWSWVSDARLLPLEFSSEEILTRAWTQAPGQSIALLYREVLRITAPEALEILVATFGVTNENRAVCIDFYAARQTGTGKTYFLLCHEQGCPAYQTKVRYEEQNKRGIFVISGQDEVAGSSKRRWRQYDYELNPRWQMVKGFSEFIGGR